MVLACTKYSTLTSCTCRSSRASLPLLAAVVVPKILKQQHNYFCLFFIVVKKSVTSWYLVRFVPIIVGSEHNTPKSMVHFQHEQTGGSVCCKYRSRQKDDSLGRSLPCFVCRRHDLWLLPETETTVFLNPHSGTKKQTLIRVPHFSAILYSVHTYIKLILVSTQQR